MSPRSAAPRRGRGSILGLALSLTLSLAAPGLACSATVAAQPAPAPGPEASPVADLSPGERAAVAEAAACLDQLRSAEGRFVQTSADGRQATGRFWLLRPGRARFDYDPPSGLQIASDGRLVSVIDRRLKTVHNYPLGVTPLGIFLARDIRLDRRVQVVRVVDRATALSVTVRAAKDPGHGQITLEFARGPMRLTGWTLTDARGQSVQVSLIGLKESPAMPKSFFDPPDPRQAMSEAPLGGR